jgi:predicted MFS family arabinose efflux permease
VLGISGLTVGITNGTSWGWTAARTLGCLVVGAACLLLAGRRSLRHPSPAVELSLFRHNRVFTAANLVALLYGCVMYTWLLVSVLFLTDVWGYTELRAGLAQTPGAVVAAIAAVVMGKVMGHLGGPRFSAAVGMAAHALVPLVLFVFLTRDRAFLSLWLPCSVLVGFGIGATMMAAMSAGAMSAPPTRFASVSALNNTARQVGGALGAAAVATILQTGAVGTGGARSLSSYLDVYLFCLILTVIAIVVAIVGLKMSKPEENNGGQVPGARPRHAVR